MADTMKGMSETSRVVPPRAAERPSPGGRVPVRSGAGSAIVLVILALLLTPVLTIAGAHQYVESAATERVDTPSDVIVVLGAAQYNGTPSPVLQSRLNHAASLYRSGISDRIMTVGGRAPGDAHSEASAGRNYLIAAGIPPTAIVDVGKGTDTLESLEAAAEVAEAKGWESATIVTDPAHTARSVAMATRLGFDARPNPSRTGDGTRVTSEYVQRETVAYLAFELMQQWSVPRIINP